MPIVKSRVVLGAAKELTAFLNLDLGLTRGAPPNPEKDLWQARRQLDDLGRRLKEQDRQLEEQKGRLENQSRQLKQQESRLENRNDRLQAQGRRLEQLQKQLRKHDANLQDAPDQLVNTKLDTGGEDGELEEFRRMVGGLWEEMGELQFEFLRERGLKPGHHFLDVGCGLLRGGVRFIPYLEPESYYGIDQNKQLLHVGWEEVEKAGLQEQRPTLVRMGDFGFERLGQTFDYALAQSVFTHLPLNYISRCLVNMDRVLKPGGVFFATFFENRGGKQHLDPVVQGDGVVSYYDKDPFHYTPDAFEWACKGTSLEPEYIGDWNHPRNQLMMAFRKADASS